MKTVGPAPHHFFAREVDARRVDDIVYHWSDDQGNAPNAGPNSIPTPFNPNPFGGQGLPSAFLSRITAFRRTESNRDRYAAARAFARRRGRRGVCGDFIAAVLLARRRPIFGLGGLLLTVPFALTRYAGHTTLTSFKIALAGVIVGLGFDARRTLNELGKTPRALIVPLALVLAATAASAVSAAFHPPAIRETLKAGEYAVTALVALVIGRLDRDDRVFCAVVAAVVGVTVVDALRDFARPQSGFYVGSHAVMRLAGHLEGPNQFAAFLGVALPVLVVALRTNRAYAAAIAVASFALMATFSRTGLVVGLGALLWTGYGSSVFGLLCAAAGAGVGLALAVAALSFAPAIGHAFSISEETQAHAGGVGMRSELWAAAVRMFPRASRAGRRSR